MLKVKDKEKTLKVAREKQFTTYKRTALKLTMTCQQKQRRLAGSRIMHSKFSKEKKTVNQESNIQQSLYQIKTESTGSRQPYNRH